MDRINNLNELLGLLKKYLQINTVPQSCWDNFITYWLPILTAAAVVGTAIGGVIKYYKTKNKETYEKILKEVYSPLYQYFVKQELFANIHGMDRDYKESPILEIKNTKTTTRSDEGITNREIEETVVLNLTRYEFVRVKNNINIGLATQELLTLLSMYEVCIFMEEKYSESDEEYWEATNLKVDVENAIRHEVFTGYKIYYKKLGMDKIKEVDLWELTDDQIIFKYEAEKCKKE